MTSQVRSKYKISTFGTCSHVGGWRPLASSEWTQFFPSYSQLNIKGTITVLTLCFHYLVHFKIKSRSQKVTRISKPQIGHATHICWSTLAKDFNYCVHCIVWNYFQQFLVKVRSRSGQKGQISNYINVSKKGIHQMQFKLRNPMVPFMLLCNVRNMLLKYVF